MTQERKTYPKIVMTAKASPDGRRVEIRFPFEMIGRSVSLEIDRYARHHIVLDPPYNGREIVGFVDKDNVQKGHLTFSPEDVGITALTPCATNQWAGLLRDTDILIGSLISDLAPTTKEETPAMKPLELDTTTKPLISFAQLKPKQDSAPKETEQQVQKEQHAKRKYTRKAALTAPCQNITIEDAVNTVNDWIESLQGKVGIDENGFLFAEIYHRIGR